MKRRFLWVTVVMLLAAPVRASEPAPIRLGYDVYTGGLHIFDLQVEFTLEPVRYAAVSRLKTRGLFETLFEWQSVSRSSGKLTGLSVSPEAYLSSGTFRGKARRTEIDYAAGEVRDVRLTPPLAEDNTREPVGADLIRGTVDPLAGVLALVRQASEGGSCNGQVASFDGRRRFDLSLQHKGSERIELGKPVFYSGDAQICEFTYRMIAGFARRVPWGEDRQRVPQSGRAWLAGVGATQVLVPVRVEMDGSWGRTIAHLRASPFHEARR